MTRYGAAVASVLIGLIFVGVGLASGNQPFALAGITVMGTLAVVQVIAGRFGALRTLRGELDERESRENDQAYRVAALLTATVLFGLWLRDVFDGRIGTQPQWLLTLMGASYALTLAFFRLRDRREH